MISSDTYGLEVGFGDGHTYHPMHIILIVLYDGTGVGFGRFEHGESLSSRGAISSDSEGVVRPAAARARGRARAPSPARPSPPSFLPPAPGSRAEGRASTRRCASGRLAAGVALARAP